MKLFLQTINPGEVKDFAAAGLVHGVTATKGHDLTEILAAVPGPVSVGVSAKAEFDAMLNEGQALVQISGSKLAVRVPITATGLKVCRVLSGQGITVVASFCHSPAQALLAALAGAAYVMPSIDPVDELGSSGMQFLADVCDIYRAHFETIKTQILVTGLRSVAQVTEAAKLGAHGANVSLVLMRRLLAHPLTEAAVTRA